MIENARNVNQPISFDKNMLIPQEEKLELQNKKHKLIIGVPKESSKNENRVSLAPHAVELLVNYGHEVYIESNAGQTANFADTEYSEVGAIIKKNRLDIFQADIIVKVAPLTFQEIEMLKGHQLVISSLQIATQDVNYFKALQKKKITALSFEFLRNKSNSRRPIIESMSEISGSTSILIAAEYLSNVNNGKGELLGGIAGISPTDIVILGATTAGECAARTALGLGASVKVFDASIEKLRSLQLNLGTQVSTSIIQPRVIRKALKTADVVIGAIDFSSKNPFLVSEEIVMGMKPNSIIIDIGIDHGGCFETSQVTSHSNPIYKKYSVIHYCVPNIPSRVARTASYALSNILGQILLCIGDAGHYKQLIRFDAGFRNGIYMYEGILTSEAIGLRFGLSSRDIELLLIAF